MGAAWGWLQLFHSSAQVAADGCLVVRGAGVQMEEASTGPPTFPSPQLGSASHLLTSRFPACDFGVLMWGGNVSRKDVAGFIHFFGEQDIFKSR